MTTNLSGSVSNWKIVVKLSAKFFFCKDPFKSGQREEDDTQNFVETSSPIKDGINTLNNSFPNRFDSDDVGPKTTTDLINLPQFEEDNIRFVTH